VLEARVWFHPTPTFLRGGSGGQLAGRRTIGLPAELTAILREHRTQQAAEKKLARQLWVDGDWMFAGRTGKPLSPNMDYREWKELPVAAGTVGCTMPGTPPPRFSCSSVFPNG
jgi:hypothetical protein